MLKRYYLLALCLLCAGAHAAPFALPQPFVELVSRDIAEPIALGDIDVAVFSTPQQCDPKLTPTFFGGQKAESNQTLLQSWICTGFAAAAADPAHALAFHNILLDQRPTESVAVAATVAEIGASAGTRRYLALVDWRMEHLIEPVNCGFLCNYRLDVPMEIALFDRRSNKTVWHALRVNQSGYYSKKYEPQEAFNISAGKVQAALTQMISMEKALHALQEAGIVPAAALLPGETPALDPAVNLILINDYRSSPRYENYIHDFPVTFTLKKAGDSDDKKAYFFPSYHGYFALKLPAGQYTLVVDKKERLIDITDGSKPLYLAQSKALFGGGWSLDDLDAGKLLTKFTDAVNWALPENTPASWQSKKRVLRWLP